MFKNEILVEWTPAHMIQHMEVKKHKQGLPGLNSTNRKDDLIEKKDLNSWTDQNIITVIRRQNINQHNIESDFHPKNKLRHIAATECIRWK